MLAFVDDIDIVAHQYSDLKDIFFLQNDESAKYIGLDSSGCGLECAWTVL